MEDIDYKKMISNIKKLLNMLPDDLAAEEKSKVEEINIKLDNVKNNLKSEKG